MSWMYGSSSKFYKSDPLFHHKNVQSHYIKTALIIGLTKPCLSLYRLKFYSSNCMVCQLFMAETAYLDNSQSLHVRHLPNFNLTLILMLKYRSECHCLYRLYLYLPYQRHLACLVHMDVNGRSNLSSLQVYYHCNVGHIVTDYMLIGLGRLLRKFGADFQVIT